MEIAIFRHGKPEAIQTSKMSAAEFFGWIQAYNASSLSNASRPTEMALAYTDECFAIVCSGLKRSIDSAKALNEEKLVLSDSIFDEAGLPSANWKNLKLLPNVWAVIFRIFWLFGYSRKSESIKEAKSRASKAVKRLINLAEEHQRILFVGHGVYNRLLAKELRKAGWSGPKTPGSNYWGFGVYRL